MKKFIEVKDDFGFTIKVPVKKAKSKVKPEADIQKEIAKVFIADGWEVIRYNCGNINSTFYKAITNVNSGMTKGHPDLIAFKGCECVRIEVKSAIGKLSDDQKKYNTNGLKYGNPIAVLNSVEQAKELIELLQKYHPHEAVTIFKENL